jgi:hypothetical protein
VVVVARLLQSSSSLLPLLLSRTKLLELPPQNSRGALHGVATVLILVVAAATEAIVIVAIFHEAVL